MATLALQIEPNLAECIADNIKKLMALYDIPSAASFAEELKIGKMKLSRLLNSSIKNPKDKVLSPIAEFFSVTLEQLKGIQPIYWENIKGKLNFTTGIRIPVYELPLIDTCLTHETINAEDVTLLTDAAVSESSFAFIIKDNSFGFVFSQGTVVICDPKKKPANDLYSLVQFKDSDEYTLRKVYFDVDEVYTKSPDPMLNGNLRKLDKEDRIIATVAEIKMKF